MMRSLTKRLSVAYSMMKIILRTIITIKTKTRLLRNFKRNFLGILAASLEFQGLPITVISHSEVMDFPVMIMFNIKICCCNLSMIYIYRCNGGYHGGASITATLAPHQSATLSTSLGLFYSRAIVL